MRSRIVVQVPSDGLGLAPLVMAAASTAKSEVVKKVVSGFSRSVAGLFGDTPVDRERKAAAADALSRALNGDATGLAYLLGRAGIRADGNVKVAPKSAQHIFRTALRDYYRATGIAPDADVQAKLGLTMKVPDAGAPTTVGIPVDYAPGTGALPVEMPQAAFPMAAVVLGGLAVVLLLSGRRTR